LNQLVRKRNLRQIDSVHTMSFTRQPRLRRRQPERLMAQLIRRDQDNIHLTLDYP
jgi:hypothetical protein